MTEQAKIPKEFWIWPNLFKGKSRQPLIRPVDKDFPEIPPQILNGWLRDKPFKVIEQSAVAQLKARIENQAFAIADYQNKIYQLRENLTKHLEQNYPGSIFRAEVLKIFEEITKSHQPHPVIDQKES